MTTKISNNQNPNTMMTVKVTYSVKQEYAETNRAMITNFLKDFKKLETDQFLYSVYQKEDGITFVHFSQFTSKKAQDDVLQVPSFIAFQVQRNQNMASEHHLEILELVGASRNIFKQPVEVES